MIMTDKFLITILKRLIIAWGALAILYIFKFIFFDYYFAPDEITRYVLQYEESNEISSLYLVIAALVFVVFIISLIMVWKLKLVGRNLFLGTIILSILLILPLKYSYIDSLDYVFESAHLIIEGALLALIYLSPISKKFK